MTGSTSLFNLQINTENADYLQETAKWAKFLAIIGFVLCGFIALVGLFMSSVLTTFGRPGPGGAGFGAMLALLYLAFAAFYFVPCLYLYRFADNMKQALAAQDQATLDASFANLKSTFKFVGILMAVVLGFYALFIGIAVLGGGIALLNR